MSRTERMYKMLYMNNGYTINLSSVSVVLENKIAFKHELDVMVNEEFIHLKFDTLLDMVLFNKSLRENVIGEFYKFENIKSDIIDKYISSCNDGYNLLTPNSHIRKLDGDFIINIFAIDLYKYTGLNESLSIRIGDKELILYNINKDEYDKFNKFMIDHIGLSK